MSAKLYFSNSPAILLDKLSQNLEWADPFQPPHIAYPTPAMKRWVQMRLAEKRGILANVDFLPLEKTLWQRLEALDSQHVVSTRKPAQLLDEQGMQLLILAKLQRTPPEEARAYLDKQSRSGDGELYARRLCQLSQKLAGYFREYEYSRVHEPGRKGLANLWKNNLACFQDYLGDDITPDMRLQAQNLETWQKAIYFDLFKEGGLRDALGVSSGQYQYTLPQYAEMILNQKRAIAEPGRNAPSYHLFGLSQISPFHRSLISRLADDEALSGRHSSFFIYSLNPCSEYWEDVLTPREQRARHRKELLTERKFHAWRQLELPEKNQLRAAPEIIQQKELPAVLDENPLLSQWGKPGRENIQLWCQVTQYDFFEHFQEPPTRSVLSAVQGTLLHRLGQLPDEERLTQDDSLQILACPEIHREVETVHQGILNALIRDPSLRPDEIAVLVPNMDRYRHVLAAVFGRTEEGDPGHVPFNLSDVSASAESDYARGVVQLFDLARGRFSRKELFTLAANPCFQNAIGIDESDLKTWSDWTAKLNIFHGFDKEDKIHRGYAADDVHTWIHGLERMILGTVMETPTAGDLRRYINIVPFSDGSSQDRETLQKFLLTVQDLNRAMTPFRDDRPRTWFEWLDILNKLFDQYLSPSEEQALEGYVQSELRQYLNELRTMDALESLVNILNTESEGIAAAIPMNLITTRLENLKAGRAPHLSGGVNVAGLSALRSLPFQIVYVLGLGEGEFPDEDSASTLDLRQYRRVIGDVEPTVRNQYLFLETLICASGKLRLSYVSRDMQKGKTFQMCSVLNQLKEYLEVGILAPVSNTAPRFQITQVPLTSRSLFLFPTLFPAQATTPNPWDPSPNPFREEEILAWLEAKKVGHPDIVERLRRTASMALRNEIFPTEKDPLPPEEIPARESMKIQDICDYLENPVKYTLRHRLGIWDRDEEDLMDQEDEPFSCAFPNDSNLLQNIMQHRIENWESSTRASCRSYFEDLYRNLSLRGITPGSFYRELEHDKLWKYAGATLDGIDEIKDRLSESGGKWTCTPGAIMGEESSRKGLRLNQALSLRVPALCLDAAGREVELSGQIPCLFRDSDDQACATVVFMPFGYKAKNLLPAFLFYVAGILSDSPLGDQLRSGPFTIHYVYKGDNGYKISDWPQFQMTQDEARTYLTGLANAMLAEPDFDNLPFEFIVKDLTDKNGLVTEGDFAQSLRDELNFDEESGGFSAYTPTESMRLFEPQVPEDAEAKIRARLSPFFSKRTDQNDKSES